MYLMYINLHYEGNLTSSPEKQIKIYTYLY